MSFLPLEAGVHATEARCPRRPDRTRTDRSEQPLLKIRLNTPAVFGKDRHTEDTRHPLRAAPFRAEIGERATVWPIPN